jgi:hypothetical protein
LEDKIFNNSFNNVEYGSDRTTQQEIAINPSVSDMYEENLSENIEDVYAKKHMLDVMDGFYETSPFYEKYGQTPKKIDRSDFREIYYHFKEKLKETGEFNAVEIFCTIAEYFDLNYKVLYRDILSLENKIEILNIIEEQQGLDKQLQKSKRLF